MKLSIHLHILILGVCMASDVWGQFKEVSTNLVAVNNSSVAWGDYDNDLDLDIFLMGWNGKKRVTKIYQNTQGNFTDIQAGLPGVNSLVCNNLAWGDYDNDGDLDVLLTGQDGYERITKIFQNTGEKFKEVITALPGVFASSVAWGDYDGDGDLDVVLTGRNNQYQRITKVYTNNQGKFAPSFMKLTGVSNGSVAWGDYDNDGDLDLLLSGRDNHQNYHTITKIYTNTNGILKEANTTLEGVARSSVAWGDYDNDGDLDILLTGLNNKRQRITKLYQNKEGKFEELSTSLENVSRSSVAWGDYDNDGDLDIILSGINTKNQRITHLYQNKEGKFDDITLKLSAISSGSVAWGDYDNDGDLDILITGEDTDFTMHTKVYENTLNTSKLPATPANLEAKVEGSNITLQWDRLAEKGITYNIRLGTKKEGTEYISPMADSQTGFRKIAEEGNNARHRSRRIKNLPTGTYYWSVQAVNAAFQGSPFSQEQTFVIK